MQINDRKNLDCGVIVRKSSMFRTKAIAHKDDVRTFGIVNLDDKNRLYITIDEEYKLGEAKDQDGKCYKIYLDKTK